MTPERLICSRKKQLFLDGFKAGMTDRDGERSRMTANTTFNADDFGEAWTAGYLAGWKDQVPGTYEEIASLSKGSRDSDKQQEIIPDIEIDKMASMLSL